MIDTEVLQALMGGPDGAGRIYGVVVGVVTNNQDGENMHRVKVRFPWLSKDDESNWARVAAPMAGNGRGAYFLPEVDDEVLVAFEHGSVEHPYVLGALWNGRDAPPESNDDGENNRRTFKSRSGHVLCFDDTRGDEAIEIVDQKGTNKITVRSADNSITIEAQGDVVIRSSAGKVVISAATGVEVKSQAAVQVEAALSVDVKANAQVNVKGAMINLN
jgi:uncharacterized protein involved in type VI secretion and phage assembly